MSKCARHFIFSRLTLLFFSSIELRKVVFNWELSGNGFGQQRAAVLADGSANLEFGRISQAHLEQEGDNRAAFLNHAPVHILYLWYLADTMDILSDVLDVLSDNVRVDAENVRTDLSRVRKKRGGSSAKSSAKKAREQDPAVPERVVQAQVEVGNALASMAIDSKETVARQYREKADEYSIRAMTEEDTPVKMKLEKLSRDYYGKATGIEEEIANLKGKLGGCNLMASFDDATVSSPTPRLGNNSAIV